MNTFEKALPSLYLARSNFLGCYQLACCSSLLLLLVLLSPELASSSPRLNHLSPRQGHPSPTLILLCQISCGGEKKFC